MSGRGLRRIGLGLASSADSLSNSLLEPGTLIASAKLRATSAAFRTGRYTKRRIQRKMKSKYRNVLLPALVLLAAPLAHAQDTPDWQFREGVHYDRLVPAQGTSSPPDKIEVAEFFTYGCAFCYQMDTYLEEWRKKQSDEVNFIHIPAVGDPPWDAHARLFLTLQATGELEAAHRDVFRAIHTENRPLLRLADQERFAERYGVSAEDFRNAYRSFGVDSQLKRIMDLMRRYRILAVPTIVVNGKYVVRGTLDSSMSELLEIVDELVQRELSVR